jgi:hypothetical protein
MADADWHYLENQFDNSTKQSKKRMKNQAQHHRDALVAAPAGIKTALIARLTPPHEAFLNKYNQWVNLRAQRKGAGLTLEELLAKLSAEDIEEIETKFKNFYKRGTPQHATAFAGGRAPYQEGAEDERVDALVNLHTRIDDIADPALDPVTDLVTAVLEPLQAARTATTTLGAQAEQARTQIESLRVALAGALYKNMAGLMQELGPVEEVAAFFDLTLLRETGADEEDPEPIPPPPPVVP